MHPVFYKIWARSGPTSIKEAQNYVYGNKASTGELRLADPEHLAGVDRRTMNLLGHDCAIKGRYLTTVGSLNFEENPSRQVLVEVFNHFVDFSYAGIDRQKRCVVGVKHLKLLKYTGLESADVHFINLPVLLGCGRVFRPYYWRGSRFGYDLWAEKMNYTYGFSSPFDPVRRRVTAPRAYASDTPEMVEFKRGIGELVNAAWGRGALDCGRDVIDLLLAQPGVRQASHSKYGLTVVVADIKRPVSLTAMLFAESFNADSVREKVARLKRRTKEEVEKEFKRIVQLRADEHFRRFGQPTVRWTRNEIDNLLIKKDSNHVIPLYTNEGRAWATAVAVDRFAATEFHRLGATCDGLERRVGQINTELGESFEVAEPIVTGGGGGEGPIERLRRAIGGLGQSLRRAVEAVRGGERPATISRNPNETPGIIASIHQAAQHIARRRAMNPRSAAEVENALLSFHRGEPISERECWWLTFEPLGVKASVLKGLDVIDPMGCYDLRKTCHVMTLLTPGQGPREPGFDVQRHPSH
ncbi:DNA relaxase MbeA [Lacunisphaera limnophila]|uniref:DNA relaxase MbeA n=1 Tax=Lacunisphaera limnophila TaxID=1838286 RepID=A0A1D8ATY9_9BACT|nr:hypothetical protein [Lacunisphaera limnophila]AOS44347.1 DNA relaxase MbeA [Lacunisphaera limnophila]